MCPPHSQDNSDCSLPASIMSTATPRQVMQLMAMPYGGSHAAAAAAFGGAVALSCPGAAGSVGAAGRLALLSTGAGSYDQLLSPPALMGTSTGVEVGNAGAMVLHPGFSKHVYQRQDSTPPAPTGA